MDDRGEDWIEWNGGERPPFEADTLVAVRFRHNAQESRGWKPAINFWWHHSATHPGGDIVAYRAKPAEPAQ
jgi:hypothetical protein